MAQLVALVTIIVTIAVCLALLDLRAETKMHDVAVRYDIILALEPHLAGVARAHLAAAGDIVVI
jgi:hypothetical protein